MNTNGSSNTLTPAEQLKAKHASSGDHHVELEEVVDEDEIAHPPPVPHTLPGSSSGASSKPRAKLNVNSEEAFPSLGSSKPAAASVKSPQSWLKSPTSNGSASGVGSGFSSGKGKAPQSSSAAGVSLPGRTIERIVLAPEQITPRNELKKPLYDILRDINKRSRAKVEMREGTNGRLIFEGTGSQDDVRLALKEVANLIGSKQKAKIAVPLSVLPYLIGRQGQNIQAISKRSGAKINIPKHDSTGFGDEDDDTTIDIIIEGDAVAAELARQQIQKTVNEKTSNANMRLKDIPPEFYPFLAGPRQSNISKLSGGHDINISIPHYHTWDSIPPASAATQFVPQDSYTIKIVGDRQASQEARERIERQVENLKRQLTSHQVPIERGRHQFIIGPDGDSLHDFVSETGCSIILPPDHDDTETLYIVGPQSKIENAVNKVMDMASSMSVSNVDVARQHLKASPAHGHNLGRYLQERKALAALERQFGASIVLPTSETALPNWQIFSKDGKACMKARADVMGLISAHPPVKFHSMPVNPFFYPHLKTQAQQIRHDKGVHLLFPSNPASDSLVLVYENPGSPSEYIFPRQAPLPDQTKEIQAALQQAAQLITSIIGDDDIISKQMEAPPKFHDKVDRFVKKQQQQKSISTNSIKPQIIFGSGSSNKDFHLRGRPNDVNELEILLQQFLEQERKDEVERGFTTSFEFPHKFAGHLVGKKGDNIKKLQEEFDVEINYNENKVDLKGPQAKCQAAKSHILSLAKKLEDEATHHIKIPAQYHADIKGPKGAQVIRLQERYNVRINFPRNIVTTTDDADDATEHSFKAQPQQAPDVVVIKGTKKGADEARDELLSLFHYTQETSHSGNVSVAVKQIPSLVGAGGRELDSIRLQTGCTIEIPKREDVGPNESRVEVRLKGTKAQVENARKLIQERASMFDDSVTDSLTIEPKFYKLIIGPGGATLTKIVLDAGGPDDRREMNRIIQFPKAGSSDTEIRLQGPKAVVAKIKAAIANLVGEKEAHIEEFIIIPPEQHRHLIGPGGAIRRKIEEDNSVEVVIPKSDTKGAERAKVKLVGKPENVQQAKTYIAGLLHEQSTVSVEVPRHLHHIVSEDGALFRRLRNEYGVAVDHAGHQAPAKSDSSNGFKGRVNNSEMPLITDDSGSEIDTHAWELVDHSVPSAEGEIKTIPWVLRGNADKISSARAIVESAISTASKPSATGYLILSNPKLYRFVIGPQGSVVNGIRAQTGTTVMVPKAGGQGGEAIEVKGQKEQVEKAKDLILEAIRNSNSNGSSRSRRN